MLIAPKPGTRKYIAALSEALAVDPGHYQVVKDSQASPLPYHGHRHCAWVASAYVDLAGGIVSEELLRHGFLAALYHDAAHPGLADDDLNVRAAAEHYAHGAPHDAEIDRGLVRDMILSTSGGALGASRAGNGAMRLLHDADLLQTVAGTAEERAEWRALLTQETGLVTDDAASWEHVRDRLLTVTARRVLDRFTPAGVKA